MFVQKSRNIIGFWKLCQLHVGKIPISIAHFIWVKKNRKSSPELNLGPLEIVENQ